MRLPDEYISRMRDMLGDEYDLYAESLLKPRLYGLRVNTSKISVKEFERISPFKLRRIPYIPNGFFYDGDSISPAKHPYYYAGLYYLQDPSAMTPASRLPIDEGDRVLDLCAAPGGKTTELAARLCGSGLIVANDISAKRAKALHKNIELAGITNSFITTEYPEKLEKTFECFFDKILIDAPCSGEGMFRKDPSMVGAWEKMGPYEYRKLQEQIVSSALSMLKPGGMLLYSTCTFAPVEDEGMAEYILSLDPSLRLVDIEGYEGFSCGSPNLIGSDNEDIKKCVRIFPHEMEGEGHFLALFKKEGNDTVSDVYIKKEVSDKSIRYMSADEKKIWENFAGDNLGGVICTKRIESRDSKLYYIPHDLPKMRGVKFIRNGLFLGECKKNRFEPGQSLAMAISPNDYDNILDLSISDLRIIRYLKGETIDISDSDGIKKAPTRTGIVLICVEGYPLGWGKSNGKSIKNKYHAGWRMM